ncbi:ribonuclease HI [Candidatus Gracilibacteria bacterium]|nr:ribonuclease HI [Candidatus Gracilibacteria bacterium]MCF7898562.1 ribonuclease HI [Candidatus Paceibacterota bacterium]
MKIEIWTDGSSRGNPGPGGWSAIVMTPEEVIELGGREDLTTNNRMELLGAIHGLKEVEDRKDKIQTVEVLTDSQYVKKGMTEWIDGWIKRGWKGSTKKPVLNQDLWESLKKEEDRLKAVGMKVTWTYVQAHVGIVMNERADTIATMCADDANDLQLYRGNKKDYFFQV